jgi:mannose/cellobiose epimerase-like protein (N-acyl-D-glucosamine 2-epimerase family)
VTAQELRKAVNDPICNQVIDRAILEVERDFMKPEFKCVLETVGPNGEWFGYLHRDGSVSTTLKGNMWKGFFHLPRMQWYCWQRLDEMLA